MMAASFVALVEVCVLLFFSFLSFYNLMQYLFWILLNIWQIKLMFDLIILMQVLWLNSPLVALLLCQGMQVQLRCHLLF